MTDVDALLAEELIPDEKLMRWALAALCTHEGRGEIRVVEQLLARRLGLPERCHDRNFTETLDEISDLRKTLGIPEMI